MVGVRQNDGNGPGPRAAAAVLAWTPAAALAVITLVAVVWPIGALGLQVLRGLAADGVAAVENVPVRVVARTLGWTGLIGVAAAVLAWPAAWAARRLPVGWILLLLVPMLMPSYLAYAGWGLLRAPGTPLGDWLLAGPNWRPVAAGRALAIVGLILWAWPLAMIVLVARFRRLDAAVLDALRLEAPPLRRALTVAAMTRGATLAAIAAVTLVMLGSAVPLHLAQVETHAILLWRLLDESPVSHHWRVWAAAWPLVLFAGVAACFVACELRGHEGDSEPVAGRAPGRRVRPRDVVRNGSSLFACLLWGVSVLAPAAFFVGSIRQAGSIPRFWRANGEAIRTSTAVALAAAGVGVLIAICAWQTFARGGRAARVAAVCLGVLLAGALLPGILVGSATAAAWNMFDATRTLADSEAVVVLGHVARFGAFAALAGWWLAATEPAEQRALRRLDGADTPTGWAAAALPGGLAPLLGTGAAIAALSFHEIEAAVMLQPPGSESFARVMLQNLHFARMEDLSAGAVLVIGAGLVSTMAAVFLLGRGWSDRSV